MINEDRRQLNERFCYAFQLLEDKGIIVKNDRNGRGIGDVAERVLDNRAYGHIIRAFLNAENERVVNYTQAMTFCREFGINESWMLYGEGTPFGMDLKIKVSADRTFRTPNILFTSVEAFAGTAVGIDSFAAEKSDLFSIPGLEGSGLVAFPVTGNSMEPVIDNGDIVICRELTNWDGQLRHNEIFAVINNNSV